MPRIKKEAAPEAEAPKQADEAKPEEKIEEAKQDEGAEEKPAKKVKGEAKLERAEARGKFVLFRAGEGYVIQNNMGQLIEEGDDFDHGRKVLMDMTRGL